MKTGQYDLVIVANRLPVDGTTNPDGTTSWKRSPGGLVTALAPVVQSNQGAWIGWTGTTGPAPEPFEVDGINLIPVPLSDTEVAEYYEGFSNATLWPLYHDVITPPEFHRQWRDTYRRVNQRFAQTAAELAAAGATVWVHDYQLQLVPAMLRTMRPDLRIGFFNHIPFPSLEIFSQLPWRREILTGLLGSDLIGFQRSSDASNFLRAVRRLTATPTRGQTIAVSGGYGHPGRTVRASAFPISIDSPTVNERAHSPLVRIRAQEIRAELGSPDVVLLGVDRLDYTKGIRHRLKAFGELLDEGRAKVPGMVLVQVASPSRENVGAYQLLRDEVETTVGRINGDHASIGQPAVQYLHQSFPPEEMAALYLAADVMLVTALRDGMNLVAKEYVADRFDERGVLVLSEFAGAADELTAAIQINPHDIEEMKDAIIRAATMDVREQRRRMRSLRRRVMENDVNRWAHGFLSALSAMPRSAASIALSARSAPNRVTMTLEAGGPGAGGSSSGPASAATGADDQRINNEETR